MSERERLVRETLRRVRPPEEDAAEERAWRLVAAAYDAGAEPYSRRAGRLRRRALQLAAVLGLLGALVSPAGAGVRHWVADTVTTGREPSRPALTSLPAPGSLLVQSAAGPWVVHADGTKRLLGTWSGSTWSPHGLFVAATGGHELVTLTPSGKVHWTVTHDAPVHAAAWNAPDGFRLAYLSGSSLRVVDGEGGGDRLLEPRVAKVAPAWKPGQSYVLAFARRDGRVEAVRTSGEGRVFETGPGPEPRALQWSQRGGRLLIVRPDRLEILTADGRRIWLQRAPRGRRFLAARLSPRGLRVAAILAGAGHSRLLLTGPGARGRSLFSGPGRFAGVEWSPDGHWLLLGWQSADQWLFLDPARPRRIVAISHIAAQFAPGSARPGRAGFPRVEGWCCSR